MYTVIGNIMLCVGSFGTAFLLIYIPNDTSYTYSAPFTDHENTIITLLVISILLIAGGILTLFFGRAKAKNENALDSLTNSLPDSSIERSKCSKCGLNLSESCTVCPSCGTPRENQ